MSIPVVLDESQAAVTDPLHLLGRLGLEVFEGDGQQSVGFDPDPVLIDPHGQVSFGALGFVFDLAGAILATAHRPDVPFVHTELSLHRLGSPGGPGVTRGRVLRASSHSLIAEVDLVDDRGERMAVSTQRLSFQQSLPELEAAMAGMRAQTHELFDGRCRLRQSLPDELGITAGDEGWSIDVASDRTNGIGGLHSGVAVSLAEMAAVGSMTARWQRPARPIAATVHYLAHAILGPFVASPDVLADDGRAAVVRVPVTDAAGTLVVSAEVDVVAV